MFSALIEYISLRLADKLNEVQVVLTLHCGNSCINEHWKTHAVISFSCVYLNSELYSVYVLLE